MAQRTCSVEGCGIRHCARGYCNKHYLRWKYHAATDDRPRPDAKPRPSRCRVPGCTRKPHQLRLLCSMHVSRITRNGEVGPAHSLKGGNVCSVQGCVRKYVAKGFCNMHWMRVYKLGWSDPGPVGPVHGQGFIDKEGYRYLPCFGTHRAEHRIVMELVLGRPLVPGENVHHINGEKSDNRPENLELWTRSQPSGQRVADKVAWAIELLRRYAPDVLRGE